MMNTTGQTQNIISSGHIAAVAFPVAISGVYDYQIPEKFRDKATVGLPVLVEVKRNKMWGVILGIKDKSEYPELKEILDI
ncbi:MAG: hypothetical protein LBC70_05225, partial [Chitinispirillales bacterium]|nr:hypothetical protein [Chitinispirillales bacterium]